MASKCRLCPGLSPQRCVEQTPPTPQARSSASPRLPPWRNKLVLLVVVDAGCRFYLVPTPPWAFPAMESWGDSSSALGALCNLCTPSSPGLLGQQAGWVAFPLLFSLSFFFLFPSPKARVIYFFSPHRFRWRWSSRREGRPTPPAGLAPSDWGGGRTQQRAGAEPGRGKNK